MKRLMFLCPLLGLIMLSCEEDSEDSCNDLATTYFNSRSAWTEAVEAGNTGTEECETAKNSYQTALDAGCDKWGYTQAGLDSLDSLCNATLGGDGGGDDDGGGGADDEPDCETLTTLYQSAGQSWISSDFNFDSCATMTSASDAFLASGCDTTGIPGLDLFNSEAFPSDSCSSYANCDSLKTSYITAVQSWFNSDFDVDSCAVMTTAADVFLASGCDTTGTQVGNYNSTVFTSDSCEAWASDDGAYSVDPPDFIKINLIERE